MDEVVTLTAARQGVPSKMRLRVATLRVMEGPDRGLEVEISADPIVLGSHPSCNLVLTDQKMPGASGLELLAQVAARHPEVARLLITGWPEEIPPDQIEALGIRALIPKPWDDQQLKAVLRENT